MRRRPTKANCCKQYPITLKVESRRRPTPSVDTLIAFYANNVSPRNVLVRSSHIDFLVRSSHTDVLVRSSHADVLARSSHADVLVRSSHTDVLAILLRNVDVPAVTAMCLHVVQFQNLFMHMSGGNEKEPQTRIKKTNCASLPHAPRCLSITSKGPVCARIWKRADQTNPTGEANTTDYGWNETENCLEHD